MKLIDAHKAEEGYKTERSLRNGIEGKLWKLRQTVGNFQIRKETALYSKEHFFNCMRGVRFFFFFFMVQEIFVWSDLQGRVGDNILKQEYKKRLLAGC